MITEYINDSLRIQERRRHVIIYAVLLISCGGIAVIAGLLTSQVANFSLVGGLFFAAGVLMAWSAETITTLISNDGNITIEYKRIFGGKTWIRRLNRSNVDRLDYVKAFDESVTAGKWRRISGIYLVVNFNEQIGLGRRLGGFYSLRAPFIKDSAPLDSEANKIAHFLKVPLNTIMSVSIKDGAKKAYNPKDKMLALFQRPSQEELDRERDNQPNVS